MKRIISTVTAAGLLAGGLLLPVTLRAEDEPENKREAHGEKGNREGFAEHMREKFGISEEQEAKLKAARRVKRDKAAAVIAELAAATRKLQDQLEDKAPETDLSTTLDRIASARRTMRAEEDKFEAALTSILTPTQRAKMAVAMKEHGRGMRGGKPGKKGGDDRHDGPEHDD